MASDTNKKCDYYIKWQDDRIASDNCVAFDFLNTQPSKLKHKRLYVFPPKNCVTKTAIHLYKHFKNTKFIFIFHKIFELPLGCEKLLLLPNSKLVKLAPQNGCNSVLTFFPSEKKVTLKLHDGSSYSILGTPNTRPRATYAIVNGGYKNPKIGSLPKIEKISANIR